MSSVLLRNARIVGGTGDPLDVVIRDGRIAAIAPVLSVENGTVTDLDGRFLGVGLRDNHVHFTQWALMRERVDVSAGGSAVETARSAAAGRRAGSPIVLGYGFRDVGWSDEPHRDVLDAVLPDVPAVLVSADLHCVWLNSRALEQFGLGMHPTGVLREQAAFDISIALSQRSTAESDRLVHESASAAAARGVVSIIDFEMTSTIDDWSRRIAGGTTSLRVQCGVYSGELESVIGRGLGTGDALPGTGGLATVGPFKIIIDGSLNTRTAYCHDPYDGSGGTTGVRELTRGELTVDSEVLERFLRRASGNRIFPAVHAIGDRANTLALDAFAAVGCRGSIEHAQLIAESDISRFATLGIVASVQPEHAMDDRDIVDSLWGDRAGRAFAFGGLERAGVGMRFGSDAPVAPLDPWISMAAAISRSRDDREPWHPEQCVSNVVAYRASTGGRSRTIAPGDLADLAITDLDPLTASGNELRTMPVSATMVDGRFTHSVL